MAASEREFGVLVGDGIGPEIVPAASATATAARAESIEISWQELPFGLSAITSHGNRYPPRR